MKSSNFIRNLFYAFGAQLISMVLSALMSLVVPKLLGIEDFSFWQLFIFYCGYSGFLHFGLVDGIYLKYGGKRYDTLDFSLIGSQFILTLILQLSIGVGVVIAAREYGLEFQRLYVVYATLVYMVIYNASAFLGYIFQAVNQTSKYSISVMIDRLFFILIVFTALFKQHSDFYFFVNFYIVSKAIALFYCMYCGKDIILAKKKINKYILKDMLNSISIGSKLLIANIASSLILGIGRIFIDDVWGIKAFGKLSFALSLTVFFLQFISQVSMVLFPALRQTERAQLRDLYINIRSGLSIFLPVIFVLYIPIKTILEIWLPEYKVSLEYMAILLPICVLDGKMQMVCNTYFKVLRKENLLLFINIVTALVSILLCAIGAYLLENINAIIIFMVLSIALRSIFSEIYLAYLMKVNITRQLILEFIILIVFITSIWLFEGILTICILIISYFLYLILNKKFVRQMIYRVKVMLKFRNDKR
ncbi:lipopolysaccharide biosynthesis protein [Priestia megaterium]|uniref:lipopolysaccharide biosynthesis protein n=1 Tax=Priestia megaterium TaxID=1404 RepID=UPI0030F4416C